MARGQNLFKHGLTKSPEHRSWLSMMTRCVWSGNEREDWALYQGKGIGVCDRWLEFLNFLEDMGNKPSPRHTIDRKDSNGNYEPGNCRWASPKEQRRNTTSVRIIDFDGRSMLLSEWASFIGICNASLSERIQKWGIEKALSTPPVRCRGRNLDGTFEKTSGH